MKFEEVRRALDVWYQQRIEEGLYNIDYTHRCSRVECKDAIEQVGIGRLRLYGCRLSGLYHQCEMGSTCALPPSDAGYRHARRNFCFFNTGDASFYCTFSGIYSTLTADQDDGDSGGMGFSDTEDFEETSTGVEVGNKENGHCILPRENASAATSAKKRPLAIARDGTDGFTAKRPANDGNTNEGSRPEDVARMQIEHKLSVHARKEMAVVNQKELIMRKIRNIVMRLCYTSKCKNAIKKVIAEDQCADYQTRVTAYIRGQQAAKQRICLDAIVALHGRSRSVRAPPLEVPDPSDGEPERIAAIVYRAWVLVTRTNVIPENARSLGLVQFTLGVLYLMCSGHTVCEQAAGLAETGGSASFVRRRTPGSALAIMDRAAPHLLLGPGSSSSGALVAGTPATPSSIAVAHDNNVSGVSAAAPAGRRIMLGSRLSEFSESAREYTILPVVEVLQKHLPPQEYLHVYASKPGTLKSSMVTRGKSIFFNTMNRINMSPRECSEFVLNAKG